MATTHSQPSMVLSRRNVRLAGSVPVNGSPCPDATANMEPPAANSSTAAAKAERHCRWNASPILASAAAR
jgi:hypothetical protein